MFTAKNDSSFYSISSLFVVAALPGLINEELFFMIVYEHGQLDVIAKLNEAMLRERTMFVGGVLRMVARESVGESCEIYLKQN